MCLLATVACVALNAVFSLCETAIMESRKSRLEALCDDDDPAARDVVALIDDPDETLSVVQSGLTLWSILLGALAAVSVSRLVVALSGCTYTVALAGSVLAVTFLNSLLGEFLPKKLALQDPEPILLRHVRLVKLVVALARPIVRLQSTLADSVLVVFGMNPNVADTVTEDEVKDLIEQATEDGTFEKAEQTMVDRIFRMSDQTAYALMTPRTQMTWLDLNDTLACNLKVIQESPYTVFPVGRDNLDNFCGIIYAKDLLDAAIEQKQPFALESYLKKPVLIPRGMEAFRVLERFQESHVHEAMVLDEYGGVIGFITLHDILEEIIDGTSAEAEPEDAQIIARSDNSWLLDGLLAIDDFKQKFELDELPNEVKDHYQTMGGFLTSYLGYIPKVGERCRWNEFTFEILRLDRVRIDKVLLTRKEESAL